jgi:hypothetical protein
MKISGNSQSAFLSDAVRTRLEGVDSLTKLRMHEYLRHVAALNTPRVEVTREDGTRVVTLLRNSNEPQSIVASAVDRRLQANQGTYDRSGSPQPLPPGVLVNRKA